MRYVLMRYNRGITRAELLADLRRVAQKRGKNTVPYEEYSRFGRCSSRTFARRFGSWNTALQSAGLAIGSHYNIPTEELFANLARVWQAVGRQPVRGDMLRPLSAFTSSPYLRRFGGWRRALAAFVAWANGGNKPEDMEAGRLPAPRTTPRCANVRLRYAVLTRDFCKCQVCGRSPATDPATRLHVDHKIPWSLGGPTTLENLVTLCEKCNLGKGNSV